MCLVSSDKVLVKPHFLIKLLIRDISVIREIWKISLQMIFENSISNLFVTCNEIMPPILVFGLQGAFAKRLLYVWGIYEKECLVIKRGIGISRERLQTKMQVEHLCKERWKEVWIRVQGWCALRKLQSRKGRGLSVRTALVWPQWASTCTPGLLGFFFVCLFLVCLVWFGTSNLNTSCIEDCIINQIIWPPRHHFSF